MDYYGNNDWWGYLQHGWFRNSRKGSEKKDHKYYARIQTGIRNGQNVYRYFYSKEDYAAYIHSGKKRLTGERGSEKHPNGRIANYAMEEYTDKEGKLQTRKKYVTSDVADQLRDAEYRREKAANETDKEKKTRMKDAKKRYNKKMSATRRKRAVQKGAQKVAKLLGKQLDFKEAPAGIKEEYRYAKAGWKKASWGNAYTRTQAKK